MDILVTGGTVFASRYTAEYFIKKGHTVYVLNRGNNNQSHGAIHIKADRHALGNTLKKYHFDAVLDITAYNGKDVAALLNGLGNYDTYILLSSSAVYSEKLSQPFSESQPTGSNSKWGKYGTDKIDAENYIISHVSDYYIIRPPYLYGPMNNVYREAFVFDCAEKDMPFYLPEDGSMPLHFFHIRDLCRFMEILIEKHPDKRVYNVGNNNIITIRDWVSRCYGVLGKKPHFISVDRSVPQRNYFPFYDYAYVLDVSFQNELLESNIDLDEGLRESYTWYKHNKDKVRKKPLFQFIDKELKKEVE